MKNVVQILESLECDGSRLAKEEILEQNVNNQLLKLILVAALDPYTHYNVRKFKVQKPKVLPEQDPDSDLLQFVTNVLPRLSNREVTGNAARKLVEDSLKDMTVDCQKWAKRILLKNIRIGVQSKTVNKVWPGLINGFEVQLAKSLDVTNNQDSIIINDHINYPVICEPKLDGLRCIAVKQRGVVTMYTRNGREIDTLPLIKRHLEESTYDDFVVDGEAMGEDWNESASIIGSKKNAKNDSNMNFYIFDAMTLVDWKFQHCMQRIVARKLFVNSIVDLINVHCIKAIKTKIVNNEFELLTAYEEYLDQGCEGMMIKQLNGLYEFKRSDAMIKMKPVATYEGVVVGHYLGRDGTRHQGVFGGFNVLLPNGVITKVGGGFNDSERANFTLQGYETFYGKIAEVEGQPPLTKEGRIRNPVFTRWRHVDDVDPKVIEAYDDWKSNNVL